MCGLAGIVDLKGERSFDRRLIKAMTDRISHRGPDGDGFHLDDGVALGHRRLAIIDLNTGDQPMHSVDGSITVVYNGEIYNFHQVRAELEAMGHRFRTASDTEVLIHGWRQWGRNVVDHLRGMFAFALWDRTQKTLLLGRDKLGEKPMYYAELPDGTLAFGSEIKSLLVLNNVQRSIRAAAIEDFFALGYVPDPKSIYSQVHKLPPGHVLVARRGRSTEVFRYWDVLDGGIPSPATFATADELRDRVEEAVQAEMIADVDVGAFLSGGMDSSAVVALMSKSSGLTLRTFSIGFSEAEFDESGYAREVAEQFRTEHHPQKVSAHDVSLIDQLAEIYDEPFGDQSAIPTYIVCQHARKFVKVCLSGDGGDEAMAGYRRYRFFEAQQGLRNLLPTSVRSPFFGIAARLYPKLDRAPRWLRAKTTLEELAVDDAEAFYRMNCAMPDGVRGQLFSGDLKRELGGYRGAEVIRARFDACKDGSPLQRAQYADLTTYLPGDILVKVDRAAMANSLEVRPPLLDAEFVKWSFGLDGSLKVRGNQGKYLLKEAAAPLLPKGFLDRPKMGFSMPISSWLRNELRERVDAVLNGQSMRTSGYFNMNAAQQIWREHLSGARDHGRALWLILAFGNFLETRKGAMAVRDVAVAQG